MKEQKTKKQVSSTNRYALSTYFFDFDCSKFMNVYLFTKKILKGATIGMPLHVAFYVEIYDKVILMNRKKCQRYSLAQEYQNIEKYMTVGKLEICFKT